MCRWLTGAHSPGQNGGLRWRPGSDLSSEAAFDIVSGSYTKVKRTAEEKVIGDRCLQGNQSWLTDGMCVNWAVLAIMWTRSVTSSFEEPHIWLISWQRVRMQDKGCKSFPHFESASPYGIRVDIDEGLYGWQCCSQNCR